MTPINKQAVLKARAKQLSQVENFSQIDKGKTIEVLEFKISSEIYALESKYIKEVHPIKEFTRLPNVPPFVIGLFSIRRKVLGLIDLAYFFDLPRPKEIIGKKVIILEQDDMEFGLLTEEITNISSIPIGTIQPPLPTLTAIRQEFLKGLTNEGIVILDAQKLLNHKQLIVNEVP